MRELLGDIFVLSYDAAAGYPFRVAGTRICALFGHDVRDNSFSALFTKDSQGEIEEIIAAVTEETLPAIAGITATAQNGAIAHLELLLLPFNTRAHTPISLTGVLAPFEDNHGALGALELTSWRYLPSAAKARSADLAASSRSRAASWSMRALGKAAPKITSRQQRPYRDPRLAAAPS